ncbi:winged helix-turn-helix domain-containing protein [Pseudomonas sp. N040]|uniref:winged helix-turn-helix domain-containing protein n=1 Tax=Pseudomonas sp. N040 TaxID=2785325 RepID=UPI0018A30278|nr:winged helix-turn-helix domain-containing protein [Pseudomonas sp. N040]MBF7729233.1 YcaQ family DNA glycosylase [Pseudomonas sp. N040]MBW7012873.1 winged helix-turn-helix domain-containing protein [Pseudomonas sp. N040]
MPLDLSRAEARRLALAAQGFSNRSKAATPLAVRRLIERLGVVQIDSVNALVRSHYLPLFSRLGDYPMDWLDLQAWSSGRQRSLFEYWGHEASLLPMQLYPLLRWRMRRAAAGQGIYKEMAQFGREQQPLIRQVLQCVREQGALGAGSLSKRAERAGPWWDWSAEKHALEWLFAAGEVTVAGRRGFERLYDLPERVLPHRILEQAEPDEAAAQRQLLLHAAAALGVASEQDLRDYFRLDAADTRLRLAELAEAGELQAVRVEGWRQTAWCRGEPKVPRGLKPTALLSPFDSLIWARERTERLFDFRYRLEIYTPAHKRVYGYYVLPFMHDGQLVARVDLRAERAKGVLAVHAVHEEEMGLSETALLELAGQLRALANWLGLQHVQLNCRKAEGQRLNALLQTGTV